MIVYAMLYAAAVGVPISLAAVVIAALLRRHGKPERSVWIGGLGLSFLVPVLALLRPVTVPLDGSPLPTGGMIGVPEVMGIPEAAAVPTTGELVILAWVLASSILVVRWLVAATRLAARSRGWAADTVDGVPVRRSGDLGPAVVGLWRPRILMPDWLATLPADRRSLVLLHEQEHVRAGDPMLFAVARLARILAPWNPVVWFLTARLAIAIELDCDRRVLRRHPDVRTYGTTLLDVSSRDSSRLVAVAAFAESEAPLRSRILAMTTPPRAISIVSLLVAGALGVVLMVAAFEIPVPALRISIEVEPPPPASGPPGVVEASDRGAEPGPESRPEPDPPAVEPPAEEPPDVGETLEELRRERDARLERARESAARSATQRLDGMTEEEIRRIGLEPSFTPFTVAPRILNRDEIVREMLAAYPALLRDAGIGGSVRVYFYIDDTGRVRDTRIHQSSGHAALDEAALAVASVYRFSPALNRDTPTPVWVSFPITFQVR